MATVYLGGTPGVAAGQIPGDSISLDGASILDFHRAPQYDQAGNYLFTRMTMRVRGVYNALMSSYVVRNDAVARRPGFHAPVTDLAIRHKIAQARRQVNVFVGTSTLLQSPAPGETVDAANGPFVTVDSVAQISGARTFLVDVTISTCVNECYLFGAGTSPLLSASYKTEEDLDADFYATRTITGVATFHAGRLARLGHRPDHYRGFLLAPLEQGFHRYHVWVGVNEQGTELRWRVTDKELANSIGAMAAEKNVTRIEATQTSSFSKPDVVTPVMAAAHAGFNAWDRQLLLAAQAGGNAALAAGLVPGAAQGASVAASGAIMAQAPFKVAAAVAWAMRGFIPQYSSQLQIRVWGNRLAFRRDLRQVAATIAAWRFKNLSTTAGATNATWTDDLRGNFVAFSANVIEPPPKALFAAVGAGVAAFREFFPPPPGRMEEESLPGYISTSRLANVQPPAAGNIQLPNDRGKRGTVMLDLASSVLLEPCAVPPQADQADNAQSRRPT